MVGEGEEMPEVPEAPEPESDLQHHHQQQAEDKGSESPDELGPGFAAV